MMHSLRPTRDCIHGTRQSGWGKKYFGGSKESPIFNIDEMEVEDLVDEQEIMAASLLLSIYLYVCLQHLSHSTSYVAATRKLDSSCISR